MRIENLTISILKILQSGSELTLSVLDAALCSKTESRKKLYHLSRGGDFHFASDWANVYMRRRSFSQILQYLKREGLVERQGNGKHSSWIITANGKKKLTLTKERMQNPYSRINAYWEKPQGDSTTVISFDVPEHERKKREWLRLSLVSMGFRCLHKSVWVNTGALSEKFIHALRERDMLDYVHIFSVTKKGTVRKISPPMFSI